MEAPLQRPTDTNGETEGAISLIARGFFSKACLVTDQAWSPRSLALVVNAVATKTHGQGIPLAGALAAFRWCR